MRLGFLGGREGEEPCRMTEVQGRAMGGWWRAGGEEFVGSDRGDEVSRRGGLGFKRVLSECGKCGGLLVSGVALLSVV